MVFSESISRGENKDGNTYSFEEIKIKSDGFKVKKV